MNVDLNFRKIAWLSFCLALSACAGTPLQVESDPPGAEVVISTPGQSGRKVGQTPYGIQDSDITDKSSPLQVTLSKEGYRTTSVLIPGTIMGRTGKVSFKLEESAALPAQCVNQTEALNKMARGIAEAQSMIKAKQLEPAEKILTNMIVQYPGLSVVYDLLGNIHYLQRDFDKALVAYKKSLSLSPENSNTQRVIKQIEDIRGPRKSESGNP